MDNRLHSVFLYSCLQILSSLWTTGISFEMILWEKWPSKHLSNIIVFQDFHLNLNWQAQTPILNFKFKSANISHIHSQK